MTKVQNSATQKWAAFAAQNGQVFSSLQEMVTRAVFIALPVIMTIRKALPALGGK